MSRQSKGPRLYLRRGRTDAATGKAIPDRWFIRDGSREIGTGCGVERLDEAEQQLAAYIGEKWTAPVSESDPAKVLVADVLALYSHERGPKLKSDAATMKGFVGHLLAWWGASTLSDVKRSACNAYVEARAKQEIRHGQTGKRVSVQTARRELEVLSAAIGHWDGEHHLTRRPVVVLPEKTETNRDALTRSQAALLLWASMGWDLGERHGPYLPGRPVEHKWVRPSTNARTNRMHMRRFILIGLYTGSRSGVIKRGHWVETLTAPWVDLDSGIIYRRGREETESQTKRKPLVMIPRRLMAHMERWRALDEARGLTNVIHFNRAEVQSVRSGFAGCVDGAGLPEEITPHWLRHTCATWLMERDVSPWEAAGYVGMSAATLEKHYGHHRPGHQAAPRKAFG